MYKYKSGSKKVLALGIFLGILLLIGALYVISLVVYKVVNGEKVSFVEIFFFVAAVWFIYVSKESIGPMGSNSKKGAAYQNYIFIRK